MNDTHKTQRSRKYMHGHETEMDDLQGHCCCVCQAFRYSRVFRVAEFVLRLWR